jgi:hypothetical protein
MTSEVRTQNRARQVQAAQELDAKARSARTAVDRQLLPHRPTPQSVLVSARPGRRASP